MTEDVEFGRVGQQGTDLPSMRAIRGEIERQVRSKWGGLSHHERQDIEAIVLEKFHAEFGRTRLPVNDGDEPITPRAWLRKVVATAGIDEHRKALARPADPTDFFDDEDPNLERRLYAAVEGQAGPSTLAATRIDIQNAMRELARSHPRDAELVYWSVWLDLPIDQVAERAGRSREATKKALRRALDRLRSHLDGR